MSADGAYVGDSERIDEFKYARSIDFQFGSSPVSSLGVVPDGVIGFVSKPVGKGSVLPLLLGQTPLHQQRLVCSHMWIQILYQNNHIYIHLPTPTSIAHSEPYPQQLTLSISLSSYIYFLPMATFELQRLHRENEKLKTRTRDLTSSNDCLNNDLYTQSQLIARQKQEIETLKQQIKILKKRVDEEEMERQQVEHRYLMVLQKLEDELEQYKKKYSKLENKIAPLIDQDSVRLKVLNEVEGNHQLQLNNLKSTISNLKDELLKFKRENEVLRHSLQNQRMAHQQEMRRTKSLKNNEFAQDTINYLTFSMWKDMEAKLKNSYEQARKQAQFYKEKYFSAQKKYQASIKAQDFS